MASHEVRLKLNQRITIEQADATCAVWSDGERLGKLRISKGSVDWQPANGRMVYRMSWERFASLMVDNGRKVNARK